MKVMCKIYHVVLFFPFIFFGKMIGWLTKKGKIYILRSLSFSACVFLKLSTIKLIKLWTCISRKQNWPAIFILILGRLSFSLVSRIFGNWSMNSLHKSNLICLILLICKTQETLVKKIIKHDFLWMVSSFLLDGCIYRKNIYQTYYTYE